MTRVSTQKRKAASRTQSLRVAACSISMLLIATPSLTGSASEAQVFTLSWSAPQRCPQQKDVIARLRELLGATQGAPLESQLQASGAVTLVDSHYQLSLSVSDGKTERTRSISAEDCKDLGNAAAVALSLLLKDERKSKQEQLRSERASVSHEPAEPQTAPDRPAKPQETAILSTQEDMTESVSPPTARRLRLYAMLPLLSADYFTLPKLSTGLGLSVGVQLGTWRHYATVTRWRVQRLPREGAEPYEARFSQASLALSTCHLMRTQSFELAPCATAGVDLHRVTASGDRLTSSPQSMLLPSVRLGLTGAWYLTESFALFVSQDGKVTLRHTRFEVQRMLSTDFPHTIPWATAMTSVGGSWIF